MTAALRKALDTLEEASSIGGTHRPPERIAIALPGGDVGAADDPGFVDWLLAHSEDAPFGQGRKTKLDPKVRAGKRLIARDKASVHGFDPAALLDEIEPVLSPSTKLSARLTDVLVYQKGGKFERHKDTPRSPDLVGTLIVGLSIEHAGGAFVVNDGHGPKTFDWSGKADPKAVQWVALFSDVDHEIQPVKSGSRVTLVYALHAADQPRVDPKAMARKDALRAACKSIAAPPAWPLMIACGRHIIAEPDAEQPQGVSTLRGIDREIAAAIEAAGYGVSVRACIAAVPTGWGDDAPQATPFPDLQNMYAITRLKAVPPPSVIDGMGDEGSSYDMEEYMLDSLPMQQWIFRKNAAAHLAYEQACWAEEGNFGNEGYEAHLYTLAAIEVTKTKAKVAKPGAKMKSSREPEPDPAAADLPKAKPGAKKATAKKAKPAAKKAKPAANKKAAAKAKAAPKSKAKTKAKKR